MVGIIGTSLANIEKVAIPKGGKIGKKKFENRNPFKIKKFFVEPRSKV